MGIAMLYKNDQKVFFEWASETDVVRVTGFHGRIANKTPMSRFDAREHWKYLLTMGYKKALE